MTHAIVLIEAERGAMPTLGSRLADIEGVGQVYSVTGAWDFVAIVHVPRHEQLAERLDDATVLAPSRVDEPQADRSEQHARTEVNDGGSQRPACDV